MRNDNFYGIFTFSRAPLLPVLVVPVFVVVVVLVFTGVLLFTGAFTGVCVEEFVDPVFVPIGVASVRVRRFLRRLYLSFAISIATA
jgi:hypothetical protein